MKEIEIVHLAKSRRAAALIRQASVEALGADGLQFVLSPTGGGEEWVRIEVPGWMQSRSMSFYLVLIIQHLVEKLYELENNA